MKSHLKEKSFTKLGRDRYLLSRRLLDKVAGNIMKKKIENGALSYLSYKKGLNIVIPLHENGTVYIVRSKVLSILVNCFIYF